MKWYQNSYRRHLCDMHIADWDPRFLAEFDPQTYVQDLQKARVQTAMLYYQSHVGLCYFPTETGQLHRAFREKRDAMRKVEQGCHENGITVVGYYSLIFNNWAEEHHPEWAMRFPDGRTSLEVGSRYGRCCPNQTGYRDFTAAQLQEIFAWFSPEGIFFDMPFWPLPCSCDACRRRWERETGKPWPQQENDPELLTARRRWMAEFARWAAEEIRALRPGLSVEFNCAYAALPDLWPGMSEEICRAGDYTGGDLYRTFRTQSFACKLYAALSRERPFEYMTCRCMPDLKSHTVTKSRDRLELAVLLTAAHHGANLLIDAMDPTGTLDPRVYERIGEIYAREAAYEPYLTGKMWAEVGIYLDQAGKEYPDAHGWNHYTGALGAAETLARAHICGNVVCRTSLERLKEHRVMILPEPSGLDDAAVQAFREYAASGGILYFSGVGEPALLQMLTGGRCTGMTAGQYNYLAPRGFGMRLLEGFSEKYPLPITAPLPLVEGIPKNAVTASVTLPYQPRREGQFASIHSNPPGKATAYPGLAVRPFGKGTVIWSAAPLESIPGEDHRAVLLRLLAGVLPEPGWRLQTNAPKRVELVIFDEEECCRISAVDLNEEDEAEILAPFTIEVRSGRRAKCVVRLPDREPVVFEQRKGSVNFQTMPLRIFDIYEIDWSCAKEEKL